MTLENILKALEASMKHELDKIDSKLLKKRDVQDTLTTYFAEQQTRPQLIEQIRAPSLMYEYLQLSLEEREELENFRKENPGYLEGEIDAKNTIGAKFKNERDSINCYFNIHVANSLAKLVLLYNTYKPRTKMGHVSLTNFTETYDIVEGKQIVRKSFGEQKRFKTPNGAGMYYIFKKERKNNPNLTFENWIRGKIPEELFSRLMQTEYYQQSAITLERALQYYIQYQPLRGRKFVSFPNYLRFYDLASGVRILKNSGKLPLGNKFYVQFNHSNNNNFVDWLKAHVTPELFNAVMNTRYYQESKKTLTIEGVVSSYIYYQPRHLNRYVPLQAFFLTHNPLTGERLSIRPKSAKFYDHFRREKEKDKDLTFEDWIKQIVQEDLYTKLIETPYYKQKSVSQEITLEFVLQSYMRLRPVIHNTPVALINFLQCHDLITGEKIAGQKEGVRYRIRTPQGGKYYDKFKNEKTEGQTFDHWLQANTSKELYNSLIQTPYYQQRRVSH